MASRETLIIPAFLAAAAARPAKEPWITVLRPDVPDQHIVPAVLVAAVEAWARALVARGLKPGERVAICLDPSHHLYGAFLGVMMAGGIPSLLAPPSAKQKKEDQEYAFRQLLSQSGGRFLICDNTDFSALAADYVLLNPDASTQTSGVTLPAIDTLPAETAFIQYSSGTTGLKKGVAVSHEMLLSHIDDYAQSLALTTDDCICSWLPLYHDMGLITALFMPLLKGARLISMSPFDWVKRPAMLLDAIAAYRGTLCWQPNFAYQFLSKNRHGAADLSSLRLWVNCSETVLPESFTAFLKTFEAQGVRPESLGACYAMAETVFAVTSTGLGMASIAKVNMGATGKRKIASSGRPLPGVSVRILGPDKNPVQGTAIGHIAVKTPSMFSNYTGEASAQFVDGHFMTGDTGVMHAGELYVLGREKDIMIVAGRNIYPQDVEVVVDEVPGVVPGRCVAFAVPDPNLGTEGLVVLAEARELAPQTEAEMQREIARRVTLAIGVAPHAVQIKPHMWLTKATSGKISRQLNRQRYLDEAGNPPSPVLASSSIPAGAGGLIDLVRQAVKAVISRANKRADLLSDTDSFFEFGLIDSLSFVELLVELEEVFGCPPPAELVKDGLTHDSIAAIVRCYTENGILGVQATARIQGLPSKPGGDMAYARARRRELSPQFADTDPVTLLPAPYVMLMPKGHYVSPSANTDELGFRASIKDGRQIRRSDFISLPGKKGVVLGNSAIWGTGATQDSNVVHNVLNRAMPDTTWFSLALRQTTLTQERIAAELFSPLDPDHVVWISGSIFLGEGMKNGDHRHFMPYPTQVMFERAMGAEPRRADLMPLDQRAAEMSVLLEREIALFSRVFGKARNIIFAFQASLEVYDKPLHPTERELAYLFNVMPGPLRGTRNGVLRELSTLMVQQAKVFCRKYGVEFFEVAASARFQTEEWLFVDPGHMTDAGHAALADIIMEHLR